MRLAALAVPLLLPSVVCCQTIRFQHITVDNGLSQDIVTSVVQDVRGFMWFGTEDGLNRYDGYTFTVFKHDPGDSSSLSSGFIGPLLADHQGHVFVGTARGLDIIDVWTLTLRHCFDEQGNSIAASGLCSQGDSAVWIASHEGVFLCDGSRCTRASVNGRSSSLKAWGVRSDGGRLWLYGPDGLLYYDVRGSDLTPIDLPPEIRIANSYSISSVFRDSHGNLWITTYSGVFCFDTEFHLRHRCSTTAPGSERVMDARVRIGIQDSAGMIWFGTMSGLEMLNPATGTITHFLSDSSRTSNFLGDRVYALFEDRTGMLWVGTYRGGINTFAPSRQKFSVFLPPDHGVEDVLALGNSPWGDLLVGTSAGLFTAGKPPYPRWEAAATGNASVAAIARLSGGACWIGSVGGIEQLNDRLHSVRRVLLPVKDLVRLIFQDSGGNVWIGTDVSGIYTANTVTGTATRWFPPGEKFSGGVWSMFEDREHQLWMGTWNSEYTFRFNRANGSILRYGSGPHADVQLSSPSVRVFREDSRGMLWLGLWGGGIYHLDSTYHPVRHFTEIDGLGSDYVKCMEFDDRGDLWIGTERGISMLDPRTEVITTYTTRDGLLSNFFYSGASTRGVDGRLLFGSRRGFVMVDPDSIPMNHHLPPVVITRFTVLDAPLPFESWLPTRTVVLDHDQDFFSFDFVALDFTAPERNRYAYRLDGFDRDWIQTGTRRYAGYTHLDHGTYILRVKGSNNDGTWNETGAALTIVIRPAYWETWWFRALVFCAIVAGVYGLYRYRLSKVLEVERLRQRIARDLHDDIGTNLSAIVLASHLTGNADVPVSLREHVDDIRSVAMETQEHMRDIVWLLNPGNDLLGMLIARMKDDAARLMRGVPYEFTAPHQLSGKIDLTLKRNIFLIYKEALHNIVKHAGADHVSIVITMTDATLAMRIVDNGCGFDRATVIPGNGLDSLTSRAVQIGGRLLLESQPGKGTTVSLDVRIA